MPPLHCCFNILQMAIDTNTKVSLKQIEKEYGLQTFLPTILLENVKRNDIRKHIRYYLKRDATTLPNNLLSPRKVSPKATTTTTLETKGENGMCGELNILEGNGFR
jgi:hypothetical protein